MTRSGTVWRPCNSSLEMACNKVKLIESELAYGHRQTEPNFLALVALDFAWREAPDMMRL